MNYPFSDSSGKKLYFSEFDTMGYSIASSRGESADSTSVEWGTPVITPFLNEMLAQKETQSSIAPLADDSYMDTIATPSKPYSKFLHSFHIHSWAPVYYNVDRIMNMSSDNLYQMASLGATVYSQNDLGTVVTMLGYSYHEGFNSGHAMLTGSVLDCDVSASFDINDRKQRIYRDGKFSHNSEKPFWKASLTVDYPLNLYSGGWQQMVIPTVSWNMNSDRFLHGERDYLMQNITVGARYYKMRPIAPSAVFPRWGMSVSAYTRVPLGDGEDYTTLSYISGYTYFPGITRSQGVKLSFTAQHHYEENASFYYASMASLPRGYEHSEIVPTTNYLKVGLDYAIPIWAGDLSIPGFLYFKRFMIVPFGDYALDCKSGRRNMHYYSYGSDVTVQFHLFRFRYEFTMGMRFSRTAELPETAREEIRRQYDRNSFSMIFGLQL